MGVAEVKYRSEGDRREKGALGGRGSPSSAVMDGRQIVQMQAYPGHKHINPCRSW